MGHPPHIVKGETWTLTFGDENQYHVTWFADQNYSLTDQDEFIQLLIDHTDELSGDVLAFRMGLWLTIGVG
jgi:hypothetical protein